MDLVKFEEIFDAYNTYVKESGPKNLKVLKDQNKPLFNEFKTILKGFVEEFIQVKNDKIYLIERIKEVSGKSRRGKQMIEFVKNIELFLDKVKKDYILLGNA